MLVAACGEENPSATSSDDTHSVGHPTNSVENVILSTSRSNQSSQTTTTEVRGLSQETSTTRPQSRSGQVVPALTTTTTTVVNNQTSTTIEAIAEANPVPPVESVTPVVSVSPNTSTAPSKTRPTPTIAPECDVMPLANCQNVDLRGLDLYFANFQGANLAGANMSGMDLTGIDFTDANLTGANLIGATLDYAFFFNTDLTDAKLSRVSMADIVWDDTTIWPIGFVPPDY